MEKNEQDESRDQKDQNSHILVLDTPSYFGNDCYYDKSKTFYDEGLKQLVVVNGREIKRIPLRRNDDTGKISSLRYIDYL
jgi:hypothetical protein